MMPRWNLFVAIVAMRMATASVLFVPAVAAGVVVPPDSNIVDPVGDANGLNGQA